MRTVTFSDAKVAERVNSKFVPVWYNRGQGFHNCEKKTESWIFESSADCYPTKNICTFFMTPELKVVYYVAGYFAPDLFLEILGDVERLQAAKSPHEVATLHRDLSSRLAARLKEPDAAVPYGPCRYEKQEHRHGRGCARILTEAFRYRKEVHDTFVSDGAVDLDRVQHTYKFGNSFSEEARAASESDFSKPEAPVRTKSNR